MDDLILFKGAGEMASGAARRLRLAGFPIVMTELPEPLCVRRKVAFAESVYGGETSVEGIRAVHVRELSEISSVLDKGDIAVFVDPACNLLGELRPSIVIDARLAKKNLGTKSSDAKIVLGLGPGFIVGTDVHAVIETNRGHNLGRVYYSGSAEPDTGTPAPVCGITDQRVLRAAITGTWKSDLPIGSKVQAGDLVGRVGDVGVLAEISGLLRGIAHDGIRVTAGIKIGDIDPREDPEHCFTISDKANAIAGGVMEAILTLKQMR
jgi:xanthine dehydrogenase accessory factor